MEPSTPPPPFVWSPSPRLRRREDKELNPLASSTHRSSEFLEILRFPEVLVNARKSDVGDRIERLEAVHHHLADRGRVDLAFAAGLDLALDRRNQFVDPLGSDRAFAAG